MLDEAREHFQMGRVAQAEALFRRILEVEPSHAQSLYVLGGIALNDRDTTAAIDFVRRAIKADPDNATYHFSLATVLVATGRSAEAIPSLQEAVRLKPDEPEWRRHLAAALQATGQGAGAPTSVGPSQRFLVASAMALLPAALSFRFRLVAVAGSEIFLDSAHRFR